MILKSLLLAHLHKPKVYHHDEYRTRLDIYRHASAPSQLISTICDKAEDPCMHAKHIAN